MDSVSHLDGLFDLVDMLVQGVDAAGHLSHTLVHLLVI